MKLARGLIIFAAMILLLSNSPLQAYQNVGGDPPNCLDCHAVTSTNQFKFGPTSSSTDWHTLHQQHANQNCAICHPGQPGSVVPTKNCATCHNQSATATPPVSLPCDWVKNHEARTPNTCITCHDTCKTPTGPCPATATLGEDDPRLDTLRTFRDEVLAKSPNGQKLIALYYKSSKDVVAMLEKNPGLKQSTKDLLEAILPAIQQMTNQKTKRK